jgi:hypothetical protein
MPGKVEIRYSLQDEAAFTDGVCTTADKSESTVKTNTSATTGYLAFSIETLDEKYAFLNSAIVSTNSTRTTSRKETAEGDSSFGFKKSSLGSQCEYHYLL